MTRKKYRGWWKESLQKLKEDCKVTLTCKYMLNPHISLLQASFNGVTVKRHHLEEIPDSLTFQEKLESSLKTWKEEERRGIWLQIPTEKADMIPVATKVDTTIQRVPVIKQIIESVYICSKSMMAFSLYAFSFGLYSALSRTHQSQTHCKP